MMSETEIPVKNLTPEQKNFVKSKLLEVNSLLQYWQKTYNETLNPTRSISIAEIKEKILNGSIEDRFPAVNEAKQVLLSFANQYVPFLEGPVEFVILCSFARGCKKIALNRARKISAELNINESSVYEDLLQDAYCSVLHSMYYFSKSDLKLSTFILGSLKRNIERRARYDYAKLSPVSPDDTIDAYKIRVLNMENPHLTVEDIASETSMSVERTFEILQAMSPVLRVSSKLNSDSNETLFHLVESIPDDHCTIEESDNIDTVEFLKTLFDNTDECILSFTKEERDVLKAACSSNFERGWQSSFAKTYFNQSTGKPYSRARIGQIFNSAIEKIKSLKAA